MLLIVLLCAAGVQGYSQSTKPVQENVTKYSTSSSTNDVNTLSNVNNGEKQVSAQKQQLLRQLQTARTNNNMQQKQMIENQINQLDGISEVQLIENNNSFGGQVSYDSKPPFNNEHDYMSTQISSAGTWASATQTTPTGFPTAGVIWVARTEYSAAGSDTCKLYFSTNGGATFTYAYLFYFGSNMDFRANELDIELVYDGTNVWIWGVAGYQDLTNNTTKSHLFRFNTNANTYNGYTLSWPGAVTTNLYYNPRITSDNSNYTTATYIYCSASFDSTSGATHITRQKYAHLTAPFGASPTINYTMGSGNGGFYWNSSATSVGYLWSDLAYTRNTSNVDRIMTVYNIPGTANYNLYTAWTDDYGTTVTGNAVITETNLDYGARIAFNGGSAIYSGMITYVRQFSGTDWDPYKRSTTDAGGTWVANYVDASSNRARTVDVIAVRGVVNSYKVGYVQDSTAGAYAYYTGGNGTVFNQPNPLAVSPVGADSVYTKCIAGYKNGGGDDCFAVYSLGSGSGVYGSRLCQTTTAIEHNGNEIPKNYSLSQNYPNPFNPTTNIKFSIPKNSLVKLTIYDLTGKEVATLVDGQLNAGNYAYDFDASNIATGVYFYKLQSDGFTDVKKMMLVK